MKYSIDRIEENIAVCEGDDGSVLKLKLDELPKGTREGDIIEKLNFAAKKWRKCKEIYSERKENEL